jgi:hypothetical protein
VSAEQKRLDPVVIVDPITVTVDGGDGMKDVAWVEATVDRDEALRLIEPFNRALRLIAAPHLDVAVVVDAPCEREHLRPIGASPEVAVWERCEPAAEGAREFWRLIFRDSASTP